MHSNHPRSVLRSHFCPVCTSELIPKGNGFYACPKCNELVQTDLSKIQQFLLDLIEVKYVMHYTKETQDVYELTEAGKNTLDLTLDILPGIIKLRVDTNLKSNMEM